MSESGTPQVDSPVAVNPRKNVVIHTDGGCKGNPGRGGFGAVMICGIHRKELSAAYRRTTNNRMELRAAIAAIALLREPCRITLYSDSKYLIDAIRKRWLQGWQRNRWISSTKQAVKNQDLWQELLKVTATHEIDWRWVKGHAGDRENERCDDLANQAIAQGPWLEDLGCEAR